jgi:hypothetical protein
MPILLQSADGLNLRSTMAISRGMMGHSRECVPAMRGSDDDWKHPPAACSES